MNRLVLLLLCLAPVAVPPAALALFGNNPLAARESTQIANRAQIRQRLRLQAEQYLAQRRQWELQTEAVAIARRMARPLSAALPDSMDTLEAPALDLEASLRRLRALPVPGGGPDRFARRRLEVNRERIRLSRDYARITGERLASVEESLRTLEALRRESGRTGGLLEALQLGHRLEVELSIQSLRRAGDDQVHAQVLAEKRAHARALEAEARAQHQDAVRRARQRLERWRAGG